jgi:hypothetical protein
VYIAESTETPCQEWEPKMWFAKPRTLNAQKAKLLCYQCPERLECLDATVRYEQKHGETELGIRGGLDEKERKVFLDLPVAASA